METGNQKMEPMNKTLRIELSDQRKEITAELYAAIYRGKLRDEHEGHCEFRASVENKCDCNLVEALDVVRGN
jgi:hypothetical protein